MQLTKATDGKWAAEQMGDIVSKCLTKFKPYKVAICQISQVKNGLYGRDSNNKQIHAYNQEINSIADQIRDEFQWSNVYVLNYGLEANDRQDGVHTKGGGEVAFFRSHSNHTKKPKYNFCQIYFKKLFSLGFGFIKITYLLSVISIILQKVEILKQTLAQLK